jgi:hypothetical protein
VDEASFGIFFSALVFSAGAFSAGFFSAGFFSPFAIVDEKIETKERKERDIFNRDREKENLYCVVIWFWVWNCLYRNGWCALIG